jgi:hypothetical protein
MPGDPAVVSLDDPAPSSGAFAPPLSAAGLATAPYDPTRDREGVRSQLAIGLTLLLAVLVVAPFALILVGATCDGLFPASDACKRIPTVPLQDLLETLLTPIIGLVGAVTGFYFGENKGKP